jgi:hypothetical protein
MKNKNSNYGQCETIEKREELQARGSGRGARGGLFLRVGCTVAALAALALAGCMSTPHTTIAGKLNGSPFLIEAPKDGDLTGFDLTADSNGVIKVHIDHLAVKMNPAVIGQTGSADASIIQATGNVASNITAAAVTAALKGN